MTSNLLIVKTIGVGAVPPITMLAAPIMIHVHKINYMKQSIYLLIFCLLLFTSSYSQPGTLDIRFAENGIFFDTSIKVYSNTAFLQKEGKILVGGFTDDLNMDFFLMRLNNSGFIDSSFGINGKTIADIAKSNQLRSLAVQDDGKIIAGGSSYLYFVRDEEFNQIFNFNYTLLRLFPNGTIDSSFGENGTVQTDFGGIEEAYTVAIQTDGKILVGGSTGALPPGQNSPKFLLVRYLSSGQIDSSFGIDGRVTTIFNNSTDDIIKKVLLLSDGSIIVCGTINGATGIFDSGDFALAKYLPNGDLDESFGLGGKVTTRMNNTGSLLRDALLLKDGKILTVGVTNYGNEAKTRPVLVQYNSDGSLDESFGNDGIKEIVFSEGTSEGRCLNIQDNNKIIMCSYIYDVGLFGITRLDEKGIIDSSFGTNGNVIQDIGLYDSPTEILIQNDGKIIVTGYTLESIYNIFAARYYGDPTHPLFTKIKRWIRNHILNFSDANGSAT